MSTTLAHYICNDCQRQFPIYCFAVPDVSEQVLTGFGLAEVCITCQSQRIVSRMISEADKFYSSQDDLQRLMLTGNAHITGLQHALIGAGHATNPTEFESAKFRFREFVLHTFQRIPHAPGADNENSSTTETPALASVPGSSDASHAQPGYSVQVLAERGEASESEHELAEVRRSMSPEPEDMTEMDREDRFGPYVQDPAEHPETKYWLRNRAQKTSKSRVTVLKAQANGPVSQYMALTDAEKDAVDALMGMRNQAVN